jgi:Putative Actinobacterial Holin-X, holin superfamily III
MNASMQSGERPFAAVVSSILGNLEDILRSEIRLVKTEASDELSALKYGLVWLVAGVLSAFFTLSFLLGAAFFGLLRVLPDWAAALALAAGLAVIAATAVLVYRGRLAAMCKRSPASRDTPPQERLS